MRSDEFSAEGSFSGDTPHVRLAALRLYDLSRDIDSACSEVPLGEVAADSTFSDWAKEMASRSTILLERLAKNVHRLAAGILASDELRTVAEVDALVAALREDLLALLAMRDAALLRAWPPNMREFGDRAARSIGATLKRLGSVCGMLSSLMAAAGPGCSVEVSDLDVTMDLDLSHHLLVLAAESRGNVPVWKFC